MSERRHLRVARLVPTDYDGRVVGWIVHQTHTGDQFAADGDTYKPHGKDTVPLASKECPEVRTSEPQGICVALMRGRETGSANDLMIFETEADWATFARSVAEYNRTNGGEFDGAPDD